MTLTALVLHFALLRGSGWTRADAERHLAAAAAVYAQCGVEVRGEIHELDGPRGRTRFLKYASGVPGSLEELAASASVKARPLIFLVDGFEDGRGDDSAFSRADFEEGNNGDPVLFDTVFLPRAVESDAWRQERERMGVSYSVLAHELWHVLTRIGEHFNESRGPDGRYLGNIWRTRGNFIPPEDCARIRARLTAGSP